MRTVIIAFLCAVGLAAAAPADQKGVEFARPGGHSLLLDMHVPEGPGPFPAAILIHGGGFDGGSRATNMAPTFQPLADAGFAWFSIDYRMAPEFRFPQAREDVDTAIKTAFGYKMGPLELVDLVGLDTQVRLCEAFYPITLDPRAAAPPLLRRMVAAGWLGRKTGRGFFKYDGNAMFGA